MFARISYSPASTLGNQGTHAHRVNSHEELKRSFWVKMLQLCSLGVFLDITKDMVMFYQSFFEVDIRIDYKEHSMSGSGCRKHFLTSSSR